LSACLLLVPIPSAIAFIAFIEQVDRSSSSSSVAQALLTGILGILLSIPALCVIAHGYFIRSI
jgi:hypothetical protein